MTTKAQITANRQNAKKSTGPKTAEGKEVVSQNALKHGFFSRETVVKDEDQADFDRYHEAMLAEMGPVGVMEATLAERIASLSWRLRRAERMQDQALKMQIRGDRLDLIVRQLQWSYRDANGLPQEESRPEDDHMTLGRAARNDIANYRVLDRLLLYERRIENSMHKTIKELRQLQAARKAEQDAASCRGRLARASRGHPFDCAQDGLARALGQNSETNAHPAEHQSAEENSPARRRRSDLKKQSQFAPALMGTKSCAQKDYDDRLPAAPTANKANQNQFKMPASACPGVKGEIAATLRARL
jgi:hypothetical protein